MPLVLWTVTILGLVLFAGCAYANIRIMLVPGKDCAEGQRTSCIPFVGGLAGAAALLVCPVREAGFWCWVPLLADPGTGLYLVMMLLALSRAPKDQIADEPRDVAEHAEVERLRTALTGCLLGGAVGDALGLSYEGLSRVRGTRLFPAVEHYHFLGRKGCCSDDTEHACLTAQALLETTAYTPAFRADAFARHLAWKLRFWLLGLPAGIGMATLKAILRLWIGFPARSSGVRSAGNGPAMRSAVIGVRFGGEPELMRALVLASTRLTHRDPRAEQGALAVALAAACTAVGRCGNPCETFPPRLAEFLAAYPDGELLALVERAAASARRGDPTPVFAEEIGCGAGVSGYMPLSVAVALHAWFRYPENLGSALTAVVRCGGDTDTVAAIAGGIIGAGVGKKGIPEQWLRDLWEWPRSTAWMESLAGCLAGTGTGTGRIRPAPRISPFALLLRNLAFLTVVLGHGVRRMLPPY